MLKKLSRFFIIATIQLVVLVSLLFIVAPYLLESSNTILKSASTLDKTRFLSFCIRALVYLGIYFAWPHVTQRFLTNPSESLIKKTKQARLVFIGALLSIECLYWVGQL